MLYVSVERLVRRRPEIVWGVVTDIEALPSWVEGLIDAKRVSEEAFTLEFKPAGLVVKAESEITRWNPPLLVVIETRAAGLLLLDRVTLEPTIHGTKLIVASEIMFSNKLAEAAHAFHTKTRGEHLGAQAIYERSLDTLVKRIEATSQSPFR